MFLGPTRLDPPGRARPLCVHSPPGDSEGCSGLLAHVLFCPESGPLRRLHPEQDERLFRACRGPGAQGLSWAWGSALSLLSPSHPTSVLSDCPHLGRLVKREGFGVERSGFKSQSYGVESACRRPLGSALLVLLLTWRPEPPREDTSLGSEVPARWPVAWEWGLGGAWGRTGVFQEGGMWHLFLSGAILRLQVG